jgi:hypothetical protein
MTETGWLISMAVAFLCGVVVGYALKWRSHDNQIDAISKKFAALATSSTTAPYSNLNITRHLRQDAAGKIETPRRKIPPGRSTFGTI